MRDAAPVDDGTGDEVTGAQRERDNATSRGGGVRTPLVATRHAETGVGGRREGQIETVATERVDGEAGEQRAEIRCRGSL
jgi:hypothetical protein